MINHTTPLITQVLPNLQGGGAERIAVNLANDWISRGYRVDFALMDVRGEFLAELEEQVGVYNLQARRIRQVPLSLLGYLKERQPDIVLAHMWPLSSAAVLGWKMAGSPGKLFLCEHNGLIGHVQRTLSTPLVIAKMVLRWSHPKATGLVAVSKGVAIDLTQLSNLPSKSVQVIYNPVVAGKIAPRLLENSVNREQLWQGQFSKNILSVGNLKQVKNFPLLLEAFARLAEDLNAGLVILGEGSERNYLENRITELGLQHRVRLPGFISDPTLWFEAADLFVLSSDFEGLPTVLIEALACGTPVVSTACPHGSDEILDHGRYGILVPVNDSISLAQGIRTALNHTWNPAVLQARALEFSIPKQSTAYLNLFGLKY